MRVVNLDAELIGTSIVEVVCDLVTKRRERPTVLSQGDFVDVGLGHGACSLEADENASLALPFCRNVERPLVPAGTAVVTFLQMRILGLFFGGLPSIRGSNRSRGCLDLISYRSRALFAI